MTKTNLTSLIDQYGDLKAAAAALEKQKKDLEKALADVPPGSYESDRFRLTISDTVLNSDDDVLKAEIKELVDAYRDNLSSQYKCAHTVKKPSRRHLVGVPTGKDLA